MPKKVGDNKKYPKRVRNAVLNKIVEGKSLRAISKEKEMPRLSTILKWVAQDEEWADLYRAAKEMQAENIATDTDVVNKKLVSLAFDSELPSTAIGAIKQWTEYAKWRVNVLAPHKYKFDEDTSGNKKTEVVVKLISPEDQKTKSKK